MTFTIDFKIGNWEGYSNVLGTLLFVAFPLFLPANRLIKYCLETGGIEVEAR